MIKMLPLFLCFLFPLKLYAQYNMDAATKGQIEKYYRLAMQYKNGMQRQ